MTHMLYVKKPSHKEVTDTLCTTNQPERSWEADLDHLESLIDENTACILVNKFVSN